MVTFLLFLISLFFRGHIHCESIQGIRELEARRVEYNQNNMHLEGNVHILHSFAELFCQTAVLYFPKNEEKAQNCEKITLQGDVKVILSDGSKLTSQSCEIDCKTMEGVFSAEPPEKVVYIAKTDQNVESINTIQAKSKSMRIKVRKKENSSEYEISDLQGEDTVSIEYGADVSCNSDRLTIHHMSNPKHLQDSYIAYLFPVSENGFCYLYDKEAAVIAAKQIRIFPTSQKVICDHASGTFGSETAFSLQDSISFSSKILTWDQLNKSIKLENAVHVNIKNQAKVTSDESVELLLAGMSTSQIRSIHSKSKTNLEWCELSKNQCHELVCFGESHIDCEKNMAKFTSPLNPDGSISDDRQIFFKNALGFFYSDNLDLENVSWFAKKQMNERLEKIAVSGNVKMCNSTLDAIGIEKDVQIAMSDNVDIFPQKSQAVFFSHNKTPVLFYDSAKKAVVSAEKINFSRHLQQDSVKTDGRVRCFFDEKETSRIQGMLNKTKMGTTI